MRRNNESQLFAWIMVIVCTQLFMPEMFQEAWGTAIKNGQPLSFGQCVFFFTCCFGMLVCIFLALYNAKRIFECIGKGNSPFTVKTGIQIRKIAVYVLLFAVFSGLSVFHLISFPAFFMCSLFALILFCISLIFDYGCELQQEVDETLERRYDMAIILRLDRMMADRKISLNAICKALYCQPGDILEYQEDTEE